MPGSMLRSVALWPSVDRSSRPYLRVLSLQMFELWDAKVNDGNGKELYGDDFADIYAIQRLHFKAAMNNDCDHVSQSKIDQGRDRRKRGDDSFHPHHLRRAHHGSRHRQQTGVEGRCPAFWRLLRRVLFSSWHGIGRAFTKT